MSDVDIKSVEAAALRTENARLRTENARLRSLLAPAVVEPPTPRAAAPSSASLSDAPVTSSSPVATKLALFCKLFLGSQSEEGERSIERLLSASITCRLQARSLFAYLSDVFAARIRGDPVPLLT